MTKSLPERSDLEQLKRQAKDLLKAARAGDPSARQRFEIDSDRAPALHDAQRVIAREHGFASWRALKLYVETRALDAAEMRLIEAALNADTAAAQAVLTKHPDLTRRSIWSAAAWGDAAGVRAWVERDSASATMRGGPRNWPPLLYLGFGRIGGGDAARADAARTLLVCHADPNTAWTDPHWPNSPQAVLYGATGVNDYPQLARVLLEAGADPNDCESRYHAAEHNHVACLEVLREFATDFSGTDKVWGNTPLYFLLGWLSPAPAVRAGIRWLLEHGANPNVPSYIATANEPPLHAAVRHGWEIEMIELLLDHGAEVNARRGDGRTAYALAVRGGREDIAQRLLASGAIDDVSTRDRFLGACMVGDASRARALAASQPDLIASLSPDDRAMVFEASRAGRAEAVALMAELGFDLGRVDENGATPLHWAAWHGRADVVRVLAARGVPLNARDSRFDAPPIGWCAHGSQFCNAPGGDYAAVAEALIAAGADVPEGTQGSPAVMEVLPANSSRGE